MLWFGGSQGLSRFVPELEGEVRASPPIRITALRVAGFPYPVSELGETRLAGLVLEPNQNDLQVDFASLNFGVGDVLRYQFRLEGADQDWSPPADQRSVNFARLAPGNYRLQVRALNSEGILSAEPATSRLLHGFGSLLRPCSKPKELPGHSRRRPSRRG